MVATSVKFPNLTRKSFQISLITEVISRQSEPNHIQAVKRQIYIWVRNKSMLKIGTDKGASEDEIR